MYETVEYLINKIYLCILNLKALVGIYPLIFSIIFYTQFMPFSNWNTDVKWRGLGKYHIQLAMGKNRWWKLYSNTFKCLPLSPVDCHKKVKQSLYMPSRPWGFQEVKTQILRQLAHEGGRAVSPIHLLPLSPQEIYLVLISLAGWVDPKVIVRPEGLW
jgi:hypothetical protein